MIHEYTLFTSCLSALELWVSQKPMSMQIALGGGSIINTTRNIVWRLNPVTFVAAIIEARVRPSKSYRCMNKTLLDIYILFAIVRK